MLARLYRTPDIQSNAFFNQAFSVTDPETNLTAHVELQDIFGSDSELFFNAAGEPIPTSLVRKIPRDWTVSDADGNVVWVAEAIRTTAEDIASLRNALPNVAFSQLEDDMPEPVESETLSCTLHQISNQESCLTHSLSQASSTLLLSSIPQL